MFTCENFDGPHEWYKPGLSGYLVCLVHLVSLIQPNKPDRPNRPNEQDRLVDFFSILLEGVATENQERTAEGEIQAGGGMAATVLRWTRSGSY
jgi:hypothetical protein